MASKAAALNPLAQVTAEVIAADPDLSRRVKKLVNRLLDDAEWTMRFGTPAERSALTRAIMPNMLRAMQTTEADEKEASRRAGYSRMMDLMRGGEKAVAEDVGR